MAAFSDRIEVFLRMRDQARFVREAIGAGDSVERIGDKARSTNSQMQLLNAVNDKTRRGVRTLGTALGYAAAGLGIVAGAAVAAGTALGLKFNADMEQNATAFTQFLGNADRARTYLNQLYQIAATTPFEFPDLVAGARRFLAFGFSAKQTQKILRTVGDTVAGLGGGADEINRITIAFGQMRAKGRVQSEELLQLAELGVPAYQILRKELGLTADELQKKLRKGAIDADDGIRALERGMRRTFGGASRKQAQTFNGQLSTMKDYANLALGALTEPLFNLLRQNVFPKLTKGLQGITKWATSGGPKRALTAITSGFQEGAGSSTAGFQGIDAILVKIGAVSKTVTDIFVKGWNLAKGVVEDLLDALKPAQPFLENVLIPLFKGLAIGVLGSIVTGFKGFIVILKVFTTVLGFVGKLMSPFKGVIEAIGVAIGFVFGGPILKAIGAVSKFATILSWPIRILDGLVTGVLAAVVVFFKFIRPLKFLIGPISAVISRLGGVWKIVKTVMKVWSGFGFLITGFIIPRILKIINPVNVIRTGIRLLGVGFRIAAAIIGGAVRAIIGFVSTMKDSFGGIWEGLKSGLISVINWIIGKLNWLIDKVNLIPGVSIGHIQTLFDANKVNFGTGAGDPRGAVGLSADKARNARRRNRRAEGGTFGDWALVGENGPELARHTPSYTEITPLARRRSSGAGLDGAIHLHVEVPVVMRGREVTRVVADEKADWDARKGR